MGVSISKTLSPCLSQEKKENCRVDGFSIWIDGPHSANSSITNVFLWTIFNGKVKLKGILNNQSPTHQKINNKNDAAFR
jgi:hypothetical protein